MIEHAVADRRVVWGALTDPSSVVVFGASDDPNKIGGRPIAYMKRFGFTGQIIPVNPGRSTVQGLPAFPSLEASGGRPDAAIVAVGGRNAVDAVAEAAAGGVQICVVIASGFGEGGDPVGAAMRDEMLSAARASGMRLVGPNSQGVASFHSGSILSFSTLFTEAPPEDGPIGIVSQSGAMASVPYALLRERGYGVRYVHATGNDADLTVADLAESVLCDEDIKIIILYVENLADADGLRRVGALARQRQVPVLVLYGGLSPSGQRAAQSHTGALATDELAVRAFFHRIGFWLASSMEEVMDTVPIWLGNHVPTGGRIAGISSSGASCVLVSDAAHQCGLSTPEFAEGTVSSLRARMPSYASSSNPADVTAALLTDPDLLGDCVHTIAAEGTFDAFVVALPVTGAGYAVETFARSIADAAASHASLVLAVVSNSRTREVFEAEGILVYEDTLRAVRAIANVVQHPLSDSAIGDDFARWGAGEDEAAFASPDVELVDENSAGTALRRAGLAFAERVFLSPADIRKGRITHGLFSGDRVVVKAVTADTSHKTEYGLVVQAASDADSIIRAAQQVTGRCVEHGLECSGALIYEFVEGDVEFLAGAKYDLRIGAVAVAGFGGTFAELDPDTVVLVEPFTDAYVRDRLGQLRGRQIFEGFRDVVPVSQRSLASAVAKLGRYVAESGGEVIDAEVNPLICVGPSVVGVDAVIHRRVGTQAER